MRWDFVSPSTDQEYRRMNEQSTSSQSAANNEGTESDGRGSPAQEPLRLGAWVSCRTFTIDLAPACLDASFFSASLELTTTGLLCQDRDFEMTIKVSERNYESPQKFCRSAREMRRWCRQGVGRERERRGENNGTTGTPRWQEGSQMCEIWVNQWHIVPAVPKVQRKWHIMASQMAQLKCRRLSKKEEQK